jgi:hypothetical protein
LPKRGGSRAVCVVYEINIYVGDVGNAGVGIDWVEECDECLAMRWIAAGLAMGDTGGIRGSVGVSDGFHMVVAMRAASLPHRSRDNAIMWVEPFGAETVNFAA